MIFKNSIITVFHYDDVNETYTKKMFSGAEVTKAEGISADKSGDNEKTSGIIRIPSKKALKFLTAILFISAKPTIYAPTVQGLIKF